MTAHDLLRLARRLNAPSWLIRHLEDRVIAATLAALCPPPPRPALWPWILLALAAGIAAGAALVPHAEPIAQIADGGEE